MVKPTVTSIKISRKFMFVIILKKRQDKILSGPSFLKEKIFFRRKG